jgi:hypothetical protein
MAQPRHATPGAPVTHNAPRILALSLTLVLLACADDAPPGEPSPAPDAAEVVGLDVEPADAAEVIDGTDVPDETADTPDTAGDVPPEVAPDIGPTDVQAEVADAGLDNCDPLLELTASTTTALSYGLVALVPSGGTGDYRFTLVEDGSGAIVHELLGSYLAGGEVGTQDVVELTDAGCIGSASITLDVVPHLSMIPAHAEMPPLTPMAYAFEGGSGEVDCFMGLAISGGAVSPEGAFQAGATEGMDVVRCVDLATGESVEATVDVATGAVLTPSPAQIAIPLDSTYTPRILGGSGHMSYGISEPGLTFAGGRFTGDVPGRYAVEVTDDFLPATTSITVDVVAHLIASPKRAGLSSYQGHARTADINGDGRTDAVLSLYESSITAFQSGAVTIYQGTDEGLDPVPVRVLSGWERRDNFGRSISLADYDGDGSVDLAVGVDGYDTGLVDAGAIFVYYGIEDGFFEAEPTVMLPAPNSFDHVGFSVTSCDFNGDGLMDIAGSALYGENKDLEVQPTNQGAVHVWLGTPEGFSPEIDVTRFGKLPDDAGGWIDQANLQMGWFIVSGDMDGDGACELVAISRTYSHGAGRNNDGVVFLYKGVLADEASAGGLAADPHIAWGGIDDDDPSAQLGRFAAMGDVTGDGLAELLLPQYLHDAPEAESGTNHGTLRLFLGGSLPEVPGPAEILSPSLANWKSLPVNNGDQTGWNAAIGDMDGDGQDDLLVSALAGELPEMEVNTGSVAVYRGVPGQVPEATIHQTFAGFVTGDTFGMTFAVLGDQDGDTFTDLFVHAGRNDDLGPEVGRPYFVPGDGSGAIPLDLPGEAAGSQIGSGVAVVGDLDGDGYSELLVGAPEMEIDEQNAIQVGAVMLYKGTATGFNTEPDAIYKAFTGHSSGDRVGFDVADAGDFDGDGHRDMAILARYDDQPNNKNAYSHDGTCGGARNNAGAVLIFLGTGDALPDNTPDFVWYGPQVGQSLQKIAAGLDINGDGVDDFVAGGPDHDRPGNNGAGGFAVVLGRSQDGSGMPNIICANALDFVGLVANDYLGQSITTLGDVNQDGCDDFAVGARLEDNPTGSQGSMRVFLGWGGAGCPSEPSMLFLYPNWGGAQSGFASQGGLDVTGDGIPDLLVGGPRLTVNGDTVGAAWLVPGDYIASLPTEPVVDGASPGEIHPFIPPSATAGLWRYDGETDDEWLGRDVTLIPDGAGPGVAAMAIGSAYSDLSGTVRAGAVRVLKWNPDPDDPDYGFDPTPIAVMGGETWRTGGRFGEALAAGKRGEVPVVLIGGLEASAIGLDEGAAWVLELAP